MQEKERRSSKSLLVSQCYREIKQVSFWSSNICLVLCICICICLEPFHTINNVNVDQAIFMIYDICWSSHLFVNVDLYDIWYSIYLLTSLMNICVVPDNGKYFKNDTTSSPSDSPSPSSTSASPDGCYSPIGRSADARRCGRGGTTLAGTRWVLR